MKLIIPDSEVSELPIPKLRVPTVEDGELILPPTIIQEKSTGKTENSRNKTDLEREMIALDAMNPNLSNTDVAKIHGTQQSSVSAISRGFTNSTIDDRRELPGVKEIIKSVQGEIANRASEKLLKSLDIFNPEYLDHKDLPGAAIKLANVLEKTKSGFTQEGSGPRFVVYAPRVRDESHYEVIDVRANEA